MATTCKILSVQTSPSSSFFSYHGPIYSSQPYILILLQSCFTLVCKNNKFLSTEKFNMYVWKICERSMYSTIPHSFPVHRNTLQQHMKVHTGKDFKCQHEGCIFACRSQAELRNHQQVHSDRRPYHCDTCSYSAKTKPQLLR